MWRALPLVAPLVLLLSLSAGSGCGGFSAKHTKKNFISKCKIEIF